MIDQLARFDGAYGRHEVRRLMNATATDTAALGQADELAALARWAAQTVRDGRA